jgi:hypothetical protein
VPVPLALLALVCIWGAASTLLYERLEWAPYLVVALAGTILIKLSGRARNTFLYHVFGQQKSRYIGLIEQAVLLLFFMPGLLIHQAYAASGIIVAMCFFRPFFGRWRSPSIVGPSFFQKRPFEFLAGYRKSILLYLALGIVCSIAVRVDNYNLALVCMSLVLLNAFSFYAAAEEAYFIWIFKQKSRSFLIKKCRDAFVNCLLYTLPFLVTLLVFFSASFDTSLFVWFLGSAAIFLMIISKYAAYPLSFNLSQSIILGLGFSFPLLLILIIPLFIKKSLQNLNPILDD